MIVRYRDGQRLSDACVPVGDDGVLRCGEVAIDPKRRTLGMTARQYQDWDVIALEGG
jgi:hypothetical protein